MNFLIDTHSHTIASGHAYNSIDELTQEASRRGAEIIAITEHAPAMPGSCQSLYFSNLRVVPREKYGVKRLMGSEVNIIDFNGRIDLPDYILKQMDIVIASFHIPCIKPGTVAQNTKAVLNVMKNPYVAIIGHPDDERYQMEYELVVIAARDNHKLLELNDSSLKAGGPRVGARDNDIKMLELCKKHNVCISVGSDAHIAEDICNFELAYKLLQEVDFPERLIVNTDVELLYSYLPNAANSIL